MNWTSHTLTLQDLELNLDEIYLNLGYRGETPDEHFMEMVNEILARANQFCCPKVGYAFFDNVGIEKQIITINHIALKTGNVISGKMMPASKIAVFVATAGQDFDNYLQKLKAEGDIVNEFLADAIGSEIAEASVRYVSQQIQIKATEQNLHVTNSYCPGYCGWHVREQKNLFALLPENPCGIELNDSSLMHPVKSVSGIIGLGKTIEHTPYACEICGLKTCFKRKLTRKVDN